METTTEKKEKIFSVKEITRFIKDALEAKFPNIWIQGEISNFKRTSSGHVYFTLKDDSTQISAVIFRTQAMRYCASDIGNGVQVRVFGNITVYERSGNYQILCSKMEKTGLGDLQLKFLELKEKLYKMGWFDPSRKKPIPFLPKRIALVTSKEGAAVRDMLNIIFTRWPNMDVLVFPVKVQGAGAAADIASAILKINELHLASVIIAGRGGGSIEDLWAFNEFEVAEAIYKSQIPVISAVGHEVDFTIADFVADMRAETPSAAAVAVVPLQSEILKGLEGKKETISSLVDHRIRFYKDRLQSFKNHYCFREPINQIRQFYQRLDDRAEALERTMKNVISMKREKLKRFEDMLRSLSPLRVLERGYSVTLDVETGKSLKTTKDVFPGQKIVTRLSDGKMISGVEEITKDLSEN